MENNELNNFYNQSFSCFIPGLPSTQKDKTNSTLIKPDSGIVNNSQNSFFNSYVENIEKSFDSIKQQKTIQKTINTENSINNFQKLVNEIDKEEYNEIIKSVCSFSNINDHFFCKKCGIIPVIKFISFNEIIYSCNCHNNYKEQLFSFLQRTIVSMDNENNENNETENDFFEINAFFCNNHKGEKYLYYCEICKINLCRKCVRDTGGHKDHYILIYDQLMFDADKKIKVIKEKFNLNSSNFENQSSNFFDKNDFQISKTLNFIKLISILINDYNFYTNYTHFKIISNIYEFLTKAEKEKSKDIEEFEIKKQIIILNRRELQRNLNNCELIIEISIEKNNLYDINKLCEANLINLKSLSLKENNISNIKPLVLAKFKNITSINLSVNKIGDENIEYFSQLEFTKLTTFNLFSNNLTKFEFFEIFNNKKLKKLNCLYIGSNRFIEPKQIGKFNASNLNIIGLSNGIFTEKSIHFLKNFNFNNLEKIFLYSNDIYSLSFVENLELPNIKHFWINSNFIKEYNPLSKYKSLTNLNVRNNYIKNIDNLVEFIKNFKFLETLDISGNDIDLDDKNNENILLEVKSKIYEFVYY